MPELTHPSPDFAVTPQIQRGDLADLARQRFRGIVNNRQDGEAPGQPTSVEIETEATRLGLAYAYIPVVRGEPTADQAQQLRRFLARVDGPVLGGNRSIGLWTMARKLG